MKINFSRATFWAGLAIFAISFGVFGSDLRSQKTFEQSPTSLAQINLQRSEAIEAALDGNRTTYQFEAPGEILSNMPMVGEEQK